MYYRCRLNLTDVFGLHSGRRGQKWVRVQAIPSWLKVVQLAGPVTAPSLKRTLTALFSQS